MYRACDFVSPSLSVGLHSMPPLMMLTVAENLSTTEPLAAGAIPAAAALRLVGLPIMTGMHRGFLVAAPTGNHSPDPSTSSAS